MDKKLIQEIKRIKKLSNIKESKLDENFIDDITDFVGSTYHKIVDNTPIQKAADYVKKFISQFDSTKKPTSDFNETTTDDDFYKEILDGLNAPHTPENMKFLYAWRQAEGGTAQNNPFNTTKKWEGASAYGKNVAGVKNYQTAQDGIDATVKTLKNGYYNCIVNGLRNNIGALNISQSCNSALKTWGTHENTDLVTKVINSYESGSKPHPKPIQKGYFA